MASDQTVEHMEGSSGVTDKTALTCTSPPTYKKSNLKAQVPPFPTLLGEYPLLLSKTADGNAMVTNFRLCVCERKSFINLPLLMIAEVAVMESIRRLKLSCKDGSTFVCTFATSEDSRSCMELLRDKIAIPAGLQDIFAFQFYKEALEKTKSGARLTQAEMEQTALCHNDVTRSLFDQEVLRLGFDTNKHRIWKMSHANENFDFCPTYPKLHILPATVDDEKLKECTDFRAGKRFPSVVWRDGSTGVVLIRSSQPLPSFLGLSYFSNEADVFLLEEIVKACIRERDILSKQAASLAKNASRSTSSSSCKSGDEASRQVDGQGGCSGSGNGGVGGGTQGSGSPSHGGGGGGGVTHRDTSQVASSSTSSVSSVGSRGPSSSPRLGRGMLGLDVASGASPCETPAKPLLAIVDCRSRAMIWGNSFKGGGTEDEAKYKCSIIQLDLPNIHSVRDSFNKMRAVCHTYVEGSYYKSLCGSMWLSYISALLRGANIVVELMFVERRPVLVHCSDGWDRTAQIVSLAELLMDPFYRTIKGFQVLVEREWLQFGHKFGERGGHDPFSADVNQQSPVFLQFLDCVYQLTLQYPADFQFNEAYLVKLLKHSQACLFGTFLHNSEKERQHCPYKSASLWSLLKEDNTQFVNLLYSSSNRILRAHYGEHDIVLWKSVYMAGLSPFPHRSLPDFCLDPGEEDDEVRASNPAPDGGVSRSRSVDDLSKINPDNARRSSDPNIAQSPDSSGSATFSPAINSPAIHDTSSSSAEIIHYPDEASPSDGSGCFHSCDSNTTEAAVLPVTAQTTTITNAQSKDISRAGSGEGRNAESTTGGGGAADDKDETHEGNDNHQSNIDVGDGGRINTDDNVSLLNNSSPPTSSMFPSCQKDKGEIESCPTADSDVVNLESDGSAIVSSPFSSSSNTVIVKHTSGADSTAAATPEGAGVSEEAVPCEVLSSSTSQQQDGSDSNCVVLDNCNSYCSLKNDKASHPKTDDSFPPPAMLSNGDASDPTKTPGGFPDGARTISLLAERLAEEEDKKLRQVVNGNVGSSPDCNIPAVQQQSACQSPCSHCQHPAQMAQHNNGVDITVMNADERRLFDLKQIAQQQFKAASKSLTESAESSNAGQKVTNGSTPSSSVCNPEDKQQSIPISVSSRKSNGHSKLNGHNTHSNGLVEVGVTSCHTLSSDTLVGELDDALRESPHRVPVDQMLGIDTRGDGRHHPSTTANAHHLTPNRKDAAVGNGIGWRCNGCGGQDLKRTSANNKVKMVKTSSTAHAATQLSTTPSSGPGVLAVGLPQGTNKAVMCRRARTASGASSRDLSVSPSSFSSGNWSDTGRLRHASGGESSAMLANVRRSIAASVSTSTTDISDSCVGKIPATTVEKQSGNVRQHLDVDSLTLFSDHRQDLLSDLVSEKDRKISELESRLSRAIDFIRASRNRQFQQQAYPVADEFTQNDPEGGEHSSLGTISNPASDTSWEQLDETEERVVLWVPDDVVTHCAGCDKQFYFYRRKHHCRNCGKIFCYECRNYLAPMPNVYMKEPQRVCRRCHSRLMQLSPGASCDGRIPTLVADG